ncbi:MAG: hypothetical protein HN742_40210 [Lentisphaerae bacterium]|jgi:hypothetical protein|nr:hypothetical protein [Lentisphaerota bacterium]MBT7057004.1 hypothetical protein [Lentisphaerota bacterium]MBT7848160.1 hypothetical protein [Lentisphaerota bacterium]
MIAARIQREAPELFEQMHAGQVTIQAALKALNGETDDAEQQHVRASRTRMNRVLRDPERCTPFLERLDALLEEFEA